MTLITWAGGLKYLENLRSAEVSINYLYAYWVEISLNEQYVRGLFRTTVYYGSSWRGLLSSDLYFVLPVHATFILYYWFGDVELEYLVEAGKEYQKGVESWWDTSGYSRLELHNLAGKHVSKLETTSLLSGKGYLYIWESESPGPMALSRLLPQLLL